MTTFQLYADLGIAAWLLFVLVRFRRSTVVLAAGLAAAGLYTLVALARHMVLLPELGLGAPESWFATIGYSIMGLAVLLAASPLADRLAARFFDKPPALSDFRVLRQSRVKLIAGIIVAWGLGGFLEELVARGIILQSVRTLAFPCSGAPAAAALGVAVAAAGAGLMHIYQGPRAALIIAQLSILFGLLFVASGYNLWVAILSHGLYDTIAFIRFAAGKSRYSKVEGGT